MCFIKKTVFTICAHCTVELVECNKFCNKPDKTGRHTCIAPLCQHSQALAIILGFCKACEAAYTRLGVSDLNATRILWNFWSFKAARKWNYAIDPSRVPVSALTSPVKILGKSWFGYMQTCKEVSMNTIMALSVQSLANALGKQVVTESCDLCRANHRLDVHRIAIGMREATISWTRGLKSSEELFKSYGLHSGLDHPGTEEASLAALKNRSGGTLASVPPSQRQHVPQISPSSPASNGDFPMHTAGRKEGRQTKPLSAKLRMEMVPQEREAEHKRRIWELQAQTDLDDAGISAGGEDDNEEDANDEHIDFYLDDDSISVSERTRPLTYVSPHRSHNKSNSSAPQTPSLLGPLKVYALPAIPPVSPLHFAEFGFLADPADYSHRFSGLTDGQHDAFPSEPSEKAAETAPEGDPDGDLFGPAYRGSSGIATHVGPEIQAVAPPRPARVPVRCVTHGVKKQNGCQRCEVVTFWEIGLKPGEHMCSPAPEPEQF